MNKIKKIVALISAISVLSVATVSNVFAVDTSSDDTLEYTEFPFVRECEDPEISNGNETWTDIYGQKFDGYSGDGFVYLTGNSMKFEITVPEDSMYEIKVRYTQILSEDGRMQTISVNGSDYMVNFPYTDTWQDISFGRFRLKAGVNTIEIKPQYGYASYDTITVDKAEFPELKVEPTLADKNATSETQSLMNYLCSVYGNGILSGQQEIYGGGNDGDTELEFDFIKNLTGELPAIRGFDFMNYNPLYGWDDQTTERVIEWVNDRNGIATASWHINVPLDFANYTLGDTVDWKECTYNEKSDFDTSKAIVEGTKEHDYVMLAIKDLAEQLTRLQDANVPIILRPFHEAEGNGGINGEGAWFWWSKSGAEVYKELWKMLYNTLTEDYGLHNIIWEYNSYDYSTSQAWYPGDDYVDIVGYDKYNTVYNRHDGLTSGPNVDAISSTFYSLVNITNGKKMVSMPENDTVPTIENMKVEKAGWLYFCPWYGEHLMDASKNDPDTLKAIYQDDYCINLGDLPKDLYNNDIDTGTIDITTTVTKVTDEDITIEFVDDDKTYECTLKIADHFKNDEKISVGDTIIATGFGCGPVNYGDIDKWFAQSSLELKSKSTDTPTPPTGTIDITTTVTKVTDEDITIEFVDDDKTYECTLKIADHFKNDEKISVGDTIIAIGFGCGPVNYGDIDKWFAQSSLELKSKSTDTTTSSSQTTVTTTSDTTTPSQTTTSTSDTSTSTSSVSDTTTSGKETETLLGDANCDGNVRVNDIQLIRQVILHIQPAFEEGSQAFINADVTKDGSIKVNDIQKIRQYILHIINSLDDEEILDTENTVITVTTTQISY